MLKHEEIAGLKIFFDDLVKVVDTLIDDAKELIEVMDRANKAKEKAKEKLIEIQKQVVEKLKEV